ncbi:glycerophosphodiester phosphodiesterase family protein [Kocuria palustris]|uniref:glycerophosphodiester phosphodiesterase family protein n=1 Tax=Kocuria palustris TaxID=71999 RepID=UPI00119E1429|nr:glycerophosphodiester phosphodiesterase family protein [Kocuria palustris]
MTTKLALRTAAVGAALAVAASSVPAAVAAPAPAAPAERASQAEAFDLQSHRGGRAEWTESSLTAFSESLELGVTTLELDTHLTEDDVVMVWHDDTIQAEKCRDTAPATPGDPEFPYVGDRFRDLTYAQIQTLDCGYQQLPGYPLQDVVEGNRMATLQEVFELAERHGAQDGIRWNIETKVEDPADAPEREALVEGVMRTIDEHGWAERTAVQSFDWDALDQAREIDPDMTLVALAEAENPAGAGIDPQDAADRGYDVWSPTHALLTEQNIAEAHELGLTVIPWTVNSRADMERLMDWGVDGIITDYPSVLREAMADRGWDLPRPYPLEDQGRFGRGEAARAEREHTGPARSVEDVRERSETARERYMR